MILSAHSASASPGNLTSHSPIYIEGNENFTPANGVVGGSGTENDPYIIEGWKIDAGKENGIEIRDTTKYFIIKRNLIENAGVVEGRFENSYGIYLENTKNGDIKNNTLRSNVNGIVLRKSSKIILRKNIVKSNYMDGIGIFASRKSTVINNDVSRNGHRGIQILFSEYNQIINNTISNNGNDLYEDFMKNKRPQPDYFRVRTGISIQISQNTVVKKNVIDSNSGFGVQISLSFLEERPSKNTIINNVLVGNENYGLYLGGGAQNNRICHNIFENNGGEGAQAYDNGTNQWDNGYPSGGNYWSDYDGADEKMGENQSASGSDGIGDKPYIIVDGNNKDRYPLINSPGKKFALNTAVEPSNAGTVKGGGTYYEGITVLLTAYPNPHFEFENWSGGASGTENPVAVKIDSEKSVIAHFLSMRISENVGPSGGTIDHMGARIEIPENALKQKTRITLEKKDEVSTAGLKAASPVYRIEPLELSLSESATITIHYKENIFLEEGINVENLSIFRLGEGGWNELGGEVDNSLNTVSVQIDKLGKYAVFGKTPIQGGGEPEQKHVPWKLLGILAAIIIILGGLIYTKFSWKR